MNGRLQTGQILAGNSDFSIRLAMSLDPDQMQSQFNLVTMKTHHD